jgi:hypothetical protein
MGIKLGAYGKKPEYDTDECLKRFIPLVVKHAPEYDNFSLRDLTNKMKLSKKDELVYDENDFLHDLKTKLNEIGYVSVSGNGYISLTDKGRDKKNGTEPHNRISKYQKIYLPLFIIFGLSTMFFAYQNYNSNNRNDFLQSKVDSLKTDSLIYKDSVAQLKSKIELYKKSSTIDKLETKNSDDLKAE